MLPLNFSATKKYVTYPLFISILQIILGATQPFQIGFISDAWELAEAATESTTTATTSKGFKVTYFQTAC